MLQRFFAGMSQLAVQLGIRTVVVLALDPQTGQPYAVASPGAMDTMRAFAVLKWGLIDPRAPDAAEKVRQAGLAAQGAVAAVDDGDEEAVVEWPTG